MAARPATTTLLFRPRPTASTLTLARSLHAGVRAQPVPPPTAFVPDTPTFLSLIGRGLSAHAAKIPSWEALFTLSSSQLRDAGVEPARARRYLLCWRERFRQGRMGPGGDVPADAVVAAEGGSARVRLALGEVHAPGRKASVGTDPAKKRVVVPVVAGLRVVNGVVAGPHVRHVKGRFGREAEMVVAEGLWEHKRGVKVDRGERRKAEVRFKRRAEEKKKAG